MMKILQSKKIRKIMTICFIVYIIILVKLIVFKYSLPMTKEIINELDITAIKWNIKRANLKPLYTINKYIYLYKLRGILTETVFYNLIGNVIAFIPFGVLAPALFKRCRNIVVIFIISVLFVVWIETTQLVTTLGSFDVDDIILNVSGVIIGYIVYKCFSIYLNNKLHKSKNN